MKRLFWITSVDQLFFISNIYKMIMLGKYRDREYFWLRQLLKVSQCLSIHKSGTISNETKCIV